VRITTNQRDTKSNPTPDPNPNPTTKQSAVLSIQLNIVTCPTYPKKFLRDNVIAVLLLCSAVMSGVTTASVVVAILRRESDD